MKKISVLFILLGSLTLLSFLSDTNGSVLYKLNPKASSINWSMLDASEKPQNGVVNFKSGNLQIDAKRITGGFFYMDLRSLKCNSIKDAGFNADMIDWMRSQSNLHVQKLPTATMQIKKATRLNVPEGEQNFDIEAEVNIKGIKKLVKYKALVSYGKKTPFKANIVLSAADFQLDKDFNLDINAVVVKP